MATIHDVARTAEVSATTVSHVLNDSRHVSDDLRARVLSAIETLGYTPNRLAAGLRRKQTSTIGLVVPDNTNPFFAAVARAIEDASFEQGFSVILCNSDGDAAKEKFYINVLLEQRVDGTVLVAANSSADLLAPLLDSGMPLVLIDRDLPNATTMVDKVLSDNLGGGLQAVQHLLALGHRRIACVTGPSHVSPSANRVTGYRQALTDAGIALDEDLIVRGHFDFVSGFAATQRLLDLTAPPTAIFACNDLMAVGALSALVERGRRVPDDISLVGFDDIPLASYTNPRLTTVAQDQRALGAVATELLLARVKDRQRLAQVHICPTSLVLRASTAAAPA